MVVKKKKPLGSPGIAQGDGLAPNILDATALTGFNGTAWDRLRTAGAADGLGAALVGAIPSTPRRDAPAVNTAAVVTVAAVAGQRHRLTYITYNYSAAPAAATLTVENGAGTTVYSEPVAVGPVRVLLPDGGIVGSVNTALIVTLPAGGAGVSGILNIGTRSA